MIKKIQIILILALLVILFFPNQGIVQAEDPPLPPSMPSSFYGTVTVNGSPAAVGSEISAWINGEKIAWTEVEKNPEDGTNVYALKVFSDKTIDDEAEIQFKFNGQHIANEIGNWEEGANVNLDLTFTFTPEDPHQIFLPLILR